MPNDRSGDRPYPAVMYSWPNPPIEVAADEFVSQNEAAQALDTSVLAVGRMIGMGRLRAATSAGRAGVTRTSLLEELERRKRPLWRVKLFVQTILHFISF